MMKSYMDSIDVDVDTGCTISQYLKLISRRASGKFKRNKYSSYSSKYLNETYLKCMMKQLYGLI